MPKFQVTINRDHVYEVEADSKEAAVNKVDDDNLTPVTDEFQYAVATEIAPSIYDFTATIKGNRGRYPVSLHEAEELVATYPVTLPDSDEKGSIQFHLTPGGLIVDVFDHNGEIIDIFLRSPQEFADYRLVKP
jgi:hypothetical protein